MKPVSILSLTIGTSCLLVAVFFLGLPLVAVAAAGSPPPPVDSAVMAKLDPFLGVYQAVPFDTVLPGNLKAKGKLEELSLTPEMVEKQKSVNLRWDAAKNCRIVGPFRMMAMSDARFEFVPTPTGGLEMLHKNIALGNQRKIEFATTHPSAPPMWLGQSIAHWKGNDTVVFDTVGFNDQTWLNDTGAPHSDKLHLVEQYRLLSGGEYLELTATIDDPGALAKPFTYVRYFQRQRGNLGEIFCQETEWQN